MTGGRHRQLTPARSRPLRPCMGEGPGVRDPGPGVRSAFVNLRSLRVPFVPLPRPGDDVHP
jgi:hypothetical protein